MKLRKGGRSAIFNIGFSEVVLVLLIAFLVVGPKDLPKVARWLGRTVKKIRRMIKEVKREAGWDEFEKEIKDTKSDVNSTLNDLKKDIDITSDLKDASSDLNKSLNDVHKELDQTGKILKDTRLKEEE